MSPVSQGSLLAEELSPDGEGRTRGAKWTTIFQTVPTTKGLVHAYDSSEYRMYY